MVGRQRSYRPRRHEKLNIKACEFDEVGIIYKSTLTAMSHNNFVILASRILKDGLSAGSITQQSHMV